jgi:hypothetical protein
MWEFFSDQNEKEDVLTDDQKQYNFIKKKKSNWTPPTGRSEWLDLYLKLVKNSTFPFFNISNQFCHVDILI